MSTQTEITRLQDARNKIRNKCVDLGISTTTAKLDALATAIDGVTNNGAVAATVMEGASYTIPKGYHNGSGTVSGVAGGGSYTLQTKTVTPTKSEQNIAPDSGYYGMSAVTVNAIPEAYQDVSSVTATASEVLANRIIVDSTGATVAGTMPYIGEADMTLDTLNTYYAIPKGYHNGQGLVDISLETKSVTPTKSAQTVTPTSGKVLKTVTVDAIPDEYQDITGVTATAKNVLAGKKIIGSDGTAITGTMTNNGAAEKTLDTKTTQYVIPEGYHNGQGLVDISLETKTATPTESAQTVTPSSGKVLSSVSVGAIPSSYISALNIMKFVASQSTAALTQGDAEDLLSGYALWKYDTTNDTLAVVEGTMTNNGAVAATIDGLTAMSYTIPAGYHNGSGTVSLTDDIETALAAI